MEQQNMSLNQQMQNAVKAAVDYFSDVFSATGNKIKNGSLRIEKISYNKTSEKWEIVIGYIVVSQSENNSDLASIFASEPAERERTTIVVDGRNFEVEDYES